MASLQRLSLSLLSPSDKSSAAALVRAEGFAATETGEGGRGWKSAEKMGLRVGVHASQFDISAMLQEPAPSRVKAQTRWISRCAKSTTTARAGAGVGLGG